MVAFGCGAAGLGRDATIARAEFSVGQCFLNQEVIEPDRRPRVVSSRTAAGTLRVRSPDALFLKRKAKVA